MIMNFLDKPENELQNELLSLAKFEMYIPNYNRPVTTKPTRGFILGKLYPFHKGHEALIKYGASIVDELTVVVCSLPTEKIDGKLRYQWVKESFPNVRVLHYDKVIPQEPSEHPDFWKIWEREMKKLHPEPIDYVFTSEDYGYQLAEVLGATHMQFNKARDIVPVSGTAVRNSPFGNWQYIPDIVKPYFVKKVLVIGGESTGKSTLTANLSDHYKHAGYKTDGIQEFARSFIDMVLVGDMKKLEYNHITLFGERQMNLVKRSELSGTQLIISDTDAIVSAVFQDVYFGQVSDELEAVIQKEKWDLILFTQPDIPWVDDGQRNLGDQRSQINEMLKHELEKRGMKYVIISGDWKERNDTAIKAIDSLIFTNTVQV